MESLKLVAVTLLALAGLMMFAYLLNPGYTLTAVLAVTFSVLGVVMYVVTSSVPVTETELYQQLVRSVYSMLATLPTLPDKPLYTRQEDVVLVGQQVRVLSPTYLFLKWVRDKLGLALGEISVDVVAIRDLLSSLLVDTLYMCRAVYVSIVENQIRVVLARPPSILAQVLREYPEVCRHVGSPLGSLVATVLAYSLRIPVEIVLEEDRGDEYVVVVAV